MQVPSKPWSKSSQDVVQELDVDPISGLAKSKAIRRLSEFGPNVLAAEKKISKFQKFLSQFKGPVVLILLGACLITAFLGEYTDSIAIFVIVLINAFIGYVQEVKAEESVEALKNLSAPRARVMREGDVIEVPASEVTLGDILIFEAGDFIPADARIIQGSQLSAEEAVLTGESVPVTKVETPLSTESLLADRKNMLFSGTAIATGSGKAVVTAVGMGSEIGRIASMLEAAQPKKTPLQERLEQVSKKLLVLSASVVLVVALLGIFHKENYLDIVMTAISLAVAAIPEGLPTVVTVALALAVRRMSKRNAIVRHLPAVETLGSTSVICTDKTGTLTTGKMRVREIHAAQGADIALTESGVLCSNASLNADSGATGDPTEVALLYFANDKHVDIKKLREQYPRIYEWSFDSNRKRMSVAVSNGRETIIHCKGAPESVLEKCNLSENDKHNVWEQVRVLSSEGKRLLAIGIKTINNFDANLLHDPESVEINLTYLGLVAIADPPRAETIPAIKSCRESGIKIVMITGDHPITAKAIAVELGIAERGVFEGVVTGSELEKLSPKELEDKVETTAVYARVSPEHKMKIIDAWQSKGHVVAMTGDGVNDAPALKKASIGVSMGRGGTEVAKQASSMILADDNFATIVLAVEEGRAIFGNIRRTIQYLLSGNLAEILIMLGAAIAGWPAPLAPIHLLWINLVTDGFPSLALAAEPVPKDVLKGRAPSSKTFFDQRFYTEMVFIGGIISIMALILYGYMLKTTDELTAKTHVFSFLVFAELFRSFACRSEEKTFFQMGITSNIYHLVAVGIPLFFQVILHHSVMFLEIFKVQMISWKECLLMFGLTLIPVTVLEIRKMLKQKA